MHACGERQYKAISMRGQSKQIFTSRKKHGKSILKIQYVHHINTVIARLLSSADVSENASRDHGTISPIVPSGRSVWARSSFSSQGRALYGKQPHALQRHARENTLQHIIGKVFVEMSYWGPTVDRLPHKTKAFIGENPLIPQ